MKVLKVTLIGTVQAMCLNHDPKAIATDWHRVIDPISNSDWFILLITNPPQKPRAMGNVE
jgi:hypothetical protein